MRKNTTRTCRKNWGSLLFVHGGIKSMDSWHLLGPISKKTAVILELALDDRFKMLCMCFSCWSHCVFAYPRGSWVLPLCPDLQILEKQGCKTQGGALEILGTGKSYGWTYWCQPTICPGCSASEELWEREIILASVVLEAFLPSMFLAWLMGGEVKTCLWIHPINPHFHWILCQFCSAWGLSFVRGKFCCEQSYSRFTFLSGSSFV